MNSKIIAANWKMKLGLEESAALAKSFVENTTINTVSYEVLILPTLITVDRVSQVVKGSNIKVGAQNSAIMNGKAALTGEVSAEILKEMGVNATLIGHSERRTFLHETDEEVNQKVINALNSELLTIVCIGETAEERNDGKTQEILERQVKIALQNTDASKYSNLVFAYEPVWAISTMQGSRPPMLEEIAEPIQFIKSLVAEEVRVLYGGTVTPENTKEFISIDNVSGFLVGGASLDVEKFAGIIEQM